MFEYVIRNFFCKLRLQSYNFFLKKQRLDPKILKSCLIFSFAVAGCIAISRGKRMSKLLQDMSALTKLDEMDDRHSRENYHQVNVLQVIQNVLDDTALQLHDKGITPSLQVPRQMVNGQWSMVNVELLGDASLLYSIFRNLIDNVIAYAIGASRGVRRPSFLRVPGQRQWPWRTAAASRPPLRAFLSH